MSLFAFARAAAKRWPTAVALRSQAESLVMTFAELERAATGMGAVLANRVAPDQVLLSDLGNNSTNLVLQLACSRVGVSYGTAKNAKALASLTEALDVGGAVYADGASHLADVPNALSAADLLRDAAAFADASFEPRGPADAHAFFNSTSPLANGELEALAADAAKHLALTPEDTACISITLSHAFGVGSAAAACLSAGATICLPNVDGIVGCGVPSDRAAATLHALEGEGCTVLYADTHTLKALPADAHLPKLR
eukprot:CAMPEP_0119267902 /NCGR_PEP_ID=MMETSP1329-20130426/5869_1 /TAXON_ID=114041 /ORGANISM="Genus nov. species nov., Strain RCC1024" /LENGTH=254 /DNA_ID=CAMNT_0007267845 /DNA_START=98 /DNA_END=859 /DNA_ORIENTATION=-